MSALRTDGSTALGFTYDRELVSADWSLHRSGWLRLEYEYEASRDLPFEGITFDYPLTGAVEIEWLGRGPTPVWRNRLAGPVLGLWRRALAPARLSDWRDGRGFYADVHWLRMVADGGGLIVVLESEDLFVGVSSPAFPPDARHARAPVPPREALSFVHAIPPMGSKFHPAAKLGPRPDPVAGPRRGVVWLLAGGGPR